MRTIANRIPNQRYDSGEWEWPGDIEMKSRARLRATHTKYFQINVIPADMNLER